MKIALIAPPYPLEEAPSPPLGICMAASACEAAGAETKIIDYIVGQYTPEKLSHTLSEFKPDIVGATSVTLNFPAAAKIIRTVKEYDPSIITMMGGPHVSFDAENTLRSSPHIDLIVAGEAEATLLKWIPRAHNKSLWHEIKGLAFMDQDRFIQTGPAEFIRDIDALPLPSRRLLPLSKYKALGFPISIITSRGCPNQCIFCLGRKMVGFKVRYRSAEKVADEIEALMALGFTNINIADDLFTANKKRVKTLCDHLIKRGLSFTWSAFARVDTVDEETLLLMKQAGCLAVSFGIESGNPKMLKHVKKGVTVDQARRAAALCKKVGMRAHASFIVGLPGETEETLADTFFLARELGMEYGFHFLAPFPGTTVREEIDKYDLEILTNDWSRYDANSAIVRTSALAPARIEELVADQYKPIAKAWEEKKKRVAENKASDYERLEIESADRLSLIFSILSNDLIEDYGKLPVVQKESPMDVLSRMVAEKTGFETGFVRRYIKLWQDSGYLGLMKKDGMIKWEWT
ncbi:MAG: radical SAM protein [Deltaproteobacteria bacterium]|nr:radical SAM protein [Deltaproteobacteria bacterium]